MIRIGTRESQLALWQAQTVARLLSEQGIQTELVPIKSEGDMDLTTPLYKMGVQGVFTRSLDVALLNNKIDIAVHSMKDVPTELPEGITEAAILERGNPFDLFVSNTLLMSKDSELVKTQEELLNSLANTEEAAFPYITGIIATGSIRRRAQWLNRYPLFQVESLRGNVNTRLAKLEESDWNGAIFAAAGLERIEQKPGNAVELKWMLPAPAQGAILVSALKAREDILVACKKIHHEQTALCVRLERDFLSHLMGGCSTPISGYARVEEENLVFKGNMVTPDGSKKAEIEEIISINEVEGAAAKWAERLLNNGGRQIAEELK